MQFHYQARTKTGDIQKGIVEASSKEAALELLQSRKVFVTFLEEVAAQPFYTQKIKLFDRVSRKDIVIFSRQLSLMFKSEIPLLEALQTVAEQIGKFSFKEKILVISEQVKAGSPFSQALSQHPKLFSAFYISMVKSGEASGTLSKSLEYLADHLEKEYYLVSKIRGAMIYPALIVLVVLVVLILMMFYVIPNLARVLAESGQDLPFLTKLVINFSALLKSWGWLLLLILAAAIVGVLRYFKTEDGKKLKDRILLRIPLLSSFLRMIYVSRFAENLSTLIGGGLPIAQALEITSEIVGNNVYREIISELQDEVRRGEQMSATLKRYRKEFPPLLTQMIAVGEKTGSISQSLTNVVDFYRQEINRSVDNLLSILEPLLIVSLALIVAGLMGAVLLPLYKMTSF